MRQFTRYAIFMIPEPGPLSRFGAQWLGWDIEQGAAVTHPEINGLLRPVGDITAGPRKYGFHGTVKPPFRLAAGTSSESLQTDFEMLCAGMKPVDTGVFNLVRMGSFLALVPGAPCPELGQMATRFVQELDHHRAPPSKAETDRRGGANLAPRQRDLLARWGYAYVLDEFRFHMTLSGRLPRSEAVMTRGILQAAMAEILKSPIIIKSLCLCGEGPDGRFYKISRVFLAG